MPLSKSKSILESTNFNFDNLGPYSTTYDININAMDKYCMHATGAANDTILTMGRSSSRRVDEEATLAEPLYDGGDGDGAGDGDGLSPPWTKGTPQPPRCRDAWAAILFYAQFIAIGVFAIMWGIPAVQKAVATAGSSSEENGEDDQSNEDSSSQSNSSSSSSSSDFDSMGLLYGEL